MSSEPRPLRARSGIPAPPPAEHDLGAEGLSAAGTRAVLVGTGQHREGSALHRLPGVDTTLDDLERVLREVVGMSHVRRLPATATAGQVTGAVEEAVAEASGPVLFVHCGHGILGPGDELYLATHDSPADDRISGAVPYRSVRELLSGAPGGGIVLLDCCFSGRAGVPGGSDARPFASARPDGSYLLASASHFALSFAPEGARHTLFGGRLLRLLEYGDPGGPPWLTLDRVRDVLVDDVGDGGPLPSSQSEGTLGRLVVARNRAYRADLPPRGDPPADVPCPYPGMRAFSITEQRWYFGREDETERLTELVRDPAGPSPVVLVGASGSGKSSLLRAGLLPALEAHHARGADASPWPVLLLSEPTADPLGALAQRWAEVTGRGTAEVRRSFEAGGFPGPRADRRACRLLVIDQFEEVFTHCSRAERARFLRLLVPPEAVPSDGSRPKIVLAVRADHYGDCHTHPELVRALATGQFTVEPMTPRVLRAVIERPAARAGLTLEEGLVERLLEDLRHDLTTGEPLPAEAAPFLAHALRETWRQRSGTVLTLSGYQRTEGIWKSVTTSTERLYQSLDEDARLVLRRLLLSMVRLTADGEAVRHRVELSAVLSDGLARDVGRTAGEAAGGEKVREVWNRLLQERLITADRHGARISHDALLGAWRRLRSWIRDARTELLVRQRLSEAVADWLGHDRDASYLYLGSRLEQVRPWLDAGPRQVQPGMALTADERGFLAASRRAARRRRLGRRVATVVAGCTALVVAVATTVAVVQNGNARARAAELAAQRIAERADVLRAEDPATAFELGLAAYHRSPTVQSRAALLLSALSPTSPGVRHGHSGAVLNLAYRPDGRLLASSSTDGTIRLWSTDDPRRLTAGAVLRVGAPAALAWSPDGRHLAASSAHALYVWEAGDSGRPREVARVPVDDGSVYAAAFSPDGRTFAVGTTKGRVRLWDLRDPGHPVSGVAHSAGHRPVQGLAFSPDGKMLAGAGGEETVQLWHTASPGRPVTGRVIRDAPVLSLAFSPDGHLLAGGGASGEVAVWRMTDPEHPHRYRGTEADGSSSRYVTSVAFSRDGRYLAASSRDGDTATYSVDESSADLTGDDPLTAARSLPGTGKGSAVTYRPDGRGLAVGDESGGISLWSPPPDSVPGSTEAPDLVGGRLFGGSGGRYFVTSTGDRARIWPTGSAGRAGGRVAVALLPRPWTKARFLPGSSSLIAENTDRTRVRLWDFHDGRLVAGHTFPSGQTSFAASPDGELLALIDPSQAAAVLWDVRDVRHPRELSRVPAPVTGNLAPTPAFSGDSQVFALLGADGTRIWDLSLPPEPHRRSFVPASGDRDLPEGISSYGGRRLLVTDASSAGVDRAHLWPVSAHGATGKPITIGADGSQLRLVSSDLVAGISSEGLAPGDTTGIASLWSLKHPGVPIPLSGPAPPMDTIIAGGRLLVASDGATSRTGLWRVSPSGGNELLALTGESASSVDVLDVAPDDGTLVVGADTAALGGATVFLDTDFDRLHRTLCAVPHARISAAHWHRLFPDLSYEDPCG